MRGPNSTQSPFRSTSRTVRRFVLAHRRLVAGLCAALAVIAGLSAVKPPAPATDGVIVAAHDLASGTTLSADDVEVRRLPSEVAASGAYDDIDALVGESLSGPMRRGETITDMRLIGADLLAGYPADSTLATVRIADPQSLWGVAVGTYVDIVGVDVDGKKAGRILADEAQVVAMPEEAEKTIAGTSSGVSLVVCVPADKAVELTDAASRMQLGVIVSTDTGAETSD